MATVAKKGTVKLEYSLDDGTTWLNVAGVRNFDPGNTTAESLDATDYDTTGNQREYVNGYKAASDGSFSINFDSADASHLALDVAAGGAAIQMRHQYGDKWLTMPMLIKSVGKPAEIGQVMVAPVTIQAAGAPTWSDVV